MSNMFTDIVEKTKIFSEKMKTVSRDTYLLTSQMEQLRTMFEDIAVVSENNSTNSNKMVSITDQQTEMMGEISVAAKGLAEMAVELREVVEKFTVTG
jgi:methyl-accepting chemotaxis protein